VSEPSPRVIVVGSCNVDLSWRGPRLPTRGETVSGGSLARTFGGKGANQATAAARLRAVVVFVGCVGDDDFGVAARADLEGCGVDCRWLRTVDGVATGTALINIDAEGDNTITVAPGANLSLDAAQIESAIAAANGDVLITGFEIGLDSAAVALHAGRAHMMRTICNPSPVDAAAATCFAACSTVVVNEVEAAAYGGPGALLAAGAGEVVVTLGVLGAEQHRPGGTERIGGFAVEAIDTTGAGDAFCAALAVSGDPQFACAAGALACRAVGGRASQPTRAEIEALLTEPPRSRPE
jgi:ribokinase